LYFQEKCVTRNDEWHSAWINPRLPSLGVEEKRFFFPQWFLHFMKHTKPTKEDPLILVPDGYYSHTMNLVVINLSRENHVDIISLHLTTATKCNP
jgi:hypothetical protein